MEFHVEYIFIINFYVKCLVLVINAQKCVFSRKSIINTLFKRKKFDYIFDREFKVTLIQYLTPPAPPLSYVLKNSENIRVNRLRLRSFPLHHIDINFKTFLQTYLKINHLRPHTHFLSLWWWR